MGSGPCKLLHTPAHGMIDADFSPFSCFLPIALLAILGHEQPQYGRKRTEPHIVLFRKIAGRGVWSEQDSNRTVSGGPLSLIRTTDQSNAILSVTNVVSQVWLALLPDFWSTQWTRIMDHRPHRSTLLSAPSARFPVGPGLSIDCGAFPTAPCCMGCATLRCSGVHHFFHGDLSVKQWTATQWKHSSGGPLY